MTNVPFWARKWHTLITVDRPEDFSHDFSGKHLCGGPCIDII